MTRFLSHELFSIFSFAYIYIFFFWSHLMPFIWLNCFIVDYQHLSVECWVVKQHLPLASSPVSHLRNSCWPCPNPILVFGSCCCQPGPLAQDYWMCFHLLLAGFPSMKIPIPILIHQDPPPLWKTKPIPFHLPSPTVDSPLLLTQIWVWHPKLVRRFHPLFV